MVENTAAEARTAASHAVQRLRIGLCMVAPPDERDDSVNCLVQTVIADYPGRRAAIRGCWKRYRTHAAGQLCISSVEKTVESGRSRAVSHHPGRNDRRFNLPCGIPELCWRAEPSGFVNRLTPGCSAATRKMTRPFRLFVVETYYAGLPGRAVKWRNRCS